MQHAVRVMAYLCFCDGIFSVIMHHERVMVDLCLRSGLLLVIVCRESYGIFTVM